jgi:hypothetical protein
MGRRKDPKNYTPEERVEPHRTDHYKTRYGVGEVIQTGDMTASLTLALDSLRRYGGKPYRYPPTQEGLELFVKRTEEFFQYAEDLNANPEIEKKLILDIEAWTAYLGICRNTLFEYSKRGGAWTETINYVKNLINGQKKQLALNYKIPPVLYIFDATNNHDYINAAEFKMQNTTMIIKTDESALEREMISSGLSWNESTGDFNAIETKGEFIDVDVQSEDKGNESYSDPEGREP